MKRSKKILLSMLVALMMLGSLVACGGEEEPGPGPQFLEGAQTKFELKDTVILADIVDFVTDSEYTLTISKGDYSIDVTNKSIWEPFEPGEYTITYTVEEGAFKGTNTFTFIVKAPKINWDYTLPNDIYDVGQQLVFTEYFDKMNSYVESWTGYQFVMDSVTVGETTTTFTTETSYTFTQAAEHTFKFHLETEDGQRISVQSAVTVRYINAQTKQWLEDNNITAYHDVSWSDDGGVMLAKSTHDHPAEIATSISGGINEHDMSYLAYNGSYGEGDFVVVDFTGDNMPYFNFFADEVTNNIFWKRGGSDAQNKGITYTHGFRNFKTGETLGGIPSNRPQLIGVSKIYQPWKDGAPDNLPWGTSAFAFRSNVCTAPVATGSMAPIGIDYMSTTYANTRMRMIIGFSETSNADSSFTFNIILIDLDSNKIICNGGRIVTAAPLATFDFSGSIVMYATHGKDLVLDKVYAVEQDTTVEELIEKYAPNTEKPTDATEPIKAWMTENNVSTYNVTSSTVDRAVTLAKSTHDHPADVATSISGGSNVHDMSYLAYNGNYGAGDFVVVDFTGDNMPYFNFFAGEVTNSIFWRRGATEAQNKGITYTHGFRNFETGATLAGLPSNRPQLIGVSKIYQPWQDTAPDSLTTFFARKNVLTAPVASGDMAPIGIDYMSTTYANTRMRMIIGFSETSNANSSFTFNVVLINLDTGAIICNGGRIVTAAPLATFDFSGSIVMYATHGKNLVLDKVYAVEQDTTVDALIAKYAPSTEGPTEPIKAWMTENNVSAYNVLSSTADRAVTLAKSTHDGNASVATSMSGGSSPNHDMSYLAYNGNYGAGDFVVVDFTGDNMPYFNFFASEVTNSIFWKRGATDAQNKGITYTNGWRNYETGATLGGIPSNRPQLIGVSKIYQPFNDNAPDGLGTFVGCKNVLTAPVASGDMAPIGIDYMSTTYANTRMRMIIGFSETSNANSSYTFNVVLINLDTGAIICNGGRIVTAAPLATFDFSGSIVMYATHGKDLVLDKVYAIEENTTVEALIAKYAPNA